MSYNRWSEYRRRHRAALSFVVGGLLVLVGIGLVLRSSNNQAILSILLTGWFVGSIVMTYRAGGFLCPRCGRRFFEAPVYRNAFAKRCAHCGLAKWEGN